MIETVGNKPGSTQEDHRQQARWQRRRLSATSLAASQETTDKKVGSKQDTSMSAARKTAGNSVGEDLDITAGNKAGRTRHWHWQQGRCKLRIGEDLDMAIDNEIGGTRHAHRQLDRWKQRRLPTTMSVATSSGGNVAVETVWDVGNRVDNNQDQLVNSGINRFRN